MPSPIAVWFCCQCLFGPNNVSIDLHCPSCGETRCYMCNCDYGYPKDNLTMSQYPATKNAMNTDYPDTDPDHCSTDTRYCHKSHSQSDIHDTSPTNKCAYGDDYDGYGPKTYYYYCCQCNNGPKIWNHEIICIDCHHEACAYCLKA